MMLAVTLCGCATWEKPGATQADFDADKSRCTAQSFQGFPVAMTGGSTYTPPAQTNCYNYGNMTRCTTTGGTPVAAGYPFDANVVGRENAFNSCMYQAGYVKHRSNLW